MKVFCCRGCSKAIHLSRSLVYRPQKVTTTVTYTYTYTVPPVPLPYVNCLLKNAALRDSARFAL